MGLFDFLKRKPMETVSADEQLKTDTERQAAGQTIQSTEIALSGDFMMEVEDVFTITGRGTVVTGRIQSGRIAINESVTIRETGIVTQIAGIEQFRKTLDTAQEGDNVGLLLKNVSRDDIARGNHLVK